MGITLSHRSAADVISSFAFCQFVGDMLCIVGLLLGLSSLAVVEGSYRGFPAVHQMQAARVHVQSLAANRRSTAVNEFLVLTCVPTLLFLQWWPAAGLTTLFTDNRYNTYT